VSFNRGAAIFARDVNANQSALESDGSAIPINIDVAAGQALFSAGFRGFGASEVNLRSAFRSLREYSDAVTQDFGETLNDSEPSARICASAAIGQLANPELGHQWRVAWQNAESPSGTGQNRLYYAFPQQLPLWRNDN
jgi:hypothetical protein